MYNRNGGGGGGNGNGDEDEDDLRQYVNDSHGDVDEDGDDIVKNENNFIDDEYEEEDKLSSSSNKIKGSGGGGDGYDGDRNDDSHLMVLKQFTFKSVFVGLIIGGMLCFSNMYYGLQSGFITMGSLQSTLLGFLCFKLLKKKWVSIRFNHFENVLLQTVAVATATMPLAGGFVGIIPALRLLYNEENINNHNNSTSSDQSTPELPNYFTWWGLILWSFSIAFFGLFFSVPLRKQTILVEKLKFPSGTATAQMIKVLHRLKNSEVHTELLAGDYGEDQDKFNDIEQDTAHLNKLERLSMVDGDDDNYEKNEKIQSDWNKKVRVLMISFLTSMGYTLLSYFIPVLSSIPIFGNYAKSTFFWSLTPSLSYVGQGMIMGTKTGISTMVGAVVGWGILSPIAKSSGWLLKAENGVPKSLAGVKGWILWISLFIMLSESIVSLLVMVVRMVLMKMGKIKNQGKFSEAASADPAPVNQQVPHLWWIGGTVVSVIICVIIVTPLFGIKVYETLIAVILSLLTSILAVRALGETDINPVSGIGKISQIIFGLISPKNMLVNLVAGAIAEGGSQQAGDMMQDLKTGHLLKASPRVQFYGQLIGSFFSIFFAVIAYQLYSYAYTIPSDQLPALSALIWLNMARLVSGNQELAHNVLPFCIVFGVLVSFIPIVEAFRPDLEHYLPSGIAFAIGFFQTPNYTLIRFVGTLTQYFWKRRYPNSFRDYSLIVASGFVLGEGITSIITALFAVLHVPQWEFGIIK